MTQSHNVTMSNAITTENVDQSPVVNESNESDKVKEEENSQALFLKMRDRKARKIFSATQSWQTYHFLKQSSRRRCR